jgi:hypothetical protein
MKISGVVKLSVFVGLVFGLVGDVNSDGDVTATDALNVLQFAVGSKDDLQCSDQEPSSIYPDYCDSSIYGDDPACFGSFPSYCDSTIYSDELACKVLDFEKRKKLAPSYCSSSVYDDQVPCFATHPVYCSSSIYGDSPACFGSAPSYCSSSIYRDEGACVASAPEYCSSSIYRNEWSCIGSLPDYCNSSIYRNDLACFPKTLINKTVILDLAFKYNSMDVNFLIKKTPLCEQFPNINICKLE